MSGEKFESVIRDIDARFILVLDDDALKDTNAVFFKIQKAHWYYLDQHDTDIRNKVLPYLPIDTFGRMLIDRSALLKSHFAAGSADQHFAAWRAYMRRIPRCGAIILSPAMDKVLMIQPYRARGWQFPRGKLNAEETHREAAAREVMEECGVDISHLLRDDRFIEKRIDGTLHKLFIAFPMAETVATSIKCKKEISAIKWLGIAELPATPEAGKNFFAVWPFVTPLRKWIRKRTNISDNDEAFEEEQEVPASAADAVNVATFGSTDQKGWSFEDMIAANQRLGYMPARVVDEDHVRRIHTPVITTPYAIFDGARLLQVFLRAWKGSS